LDGLLSCQQPEAVKALEEAEAGPVEAEAGQEAEAAPEPEAAKPPPSPLPDAITELASRSGGRLPKSEIEAYLESIGLRKSVLALALEPLEETADDADFEIAAWWAQLNPRSRVVIEASLRGADVSRMSVSGFDAAAKLTVSDEAPPGLQDNAVDVGDAAPVEEKAADVGDAAQVQEEVADVVVDAAPKKVVDMVDALHVKVTDDGSEDVKVHIIIDV